MVWAAALWVLVVKNNMGPRAVGLFFAVVHIHAVEMFCDALILVTER